MALMKKILGLTTGGIAPNPTLYRYNRDMQQILDVSKDADALDNSQIFMGPASWDNGTEWRFLYSGQSANSIVYAPDGLTYVNVDQMFLCTKTKSNDVRSGWTKFPDVNGDPKPVFKPNFGSNQFDDTQLWLRTIIKEGSTLYGWYSGDPGVGGPYKVGMATSTDDGESWVRYSSTNIYEDPMSASRGIVVFLVCSDGNGGYIAAYSGIEPNVDGIRIATSPNKLTWTLTNTLFVGLEYGWPWNFQKYGDDYYLWLQKDFRTPSNYGPAKKMFLLKSNGSDLTTWTNLGDQLTIRGSNEFGISGFTVLQKPNGEYFALITSAKNKIEALAGVTVEPFSCIKVVELNRTDLPIANASNTFSYPSYVQWHAPLGIDTQLTEVIALTTGVLSSGSVSYSGLQFISLSGSQTLTFSGISINTSSFAFKMAISIVTTGTLELFRIGNDILVTLESGKLRVRLSSNGAGYEKDYITTVNISKPLGLSYIDNHIYIGFTFAGGVLKLYNDFVEFTAGQITKTVDTTLTNINNSQSSILIGQNSVIEVRSPSILNGATDQQFIDLDI